MWSRPASGKVWTPLEPAAVRPASRAAALTDWLDAGGWSPRPSNQMTASRATRASTATPVQSRVRWRRRFSSSRRAAAPLASLPLSGGRRFLAAVPVPVPEPRPGWLLPVGAGLVLGLRVSAIDALRIGGKAVPGDSSGVRAVRGHAVEEATGHGCAADQVDRAVDPGHRGVRAQ